MSETNENIAVEETGDVVTVTYKTMSKEIFTIDVNKEGTLKDLRDKIEERHEKTVSRIIHTGKLLTDDTTPVVGLDQHFAVVMFGKPLVKKEETPPSFAISASPPSTPPPTTLVTEVNPDLLADKPEEQPDPVATGENLFAPTGAEALTEEDFKSNKYINLSPYLFSLIVQGLRNPDILMKIFENDPQIRQIIENDPEELKKLVSNPSFFGSFLQLLSVMMGDVSQLGLGGGMPGAPGPAQPGPAHAEPSIDDIHPGMTDANKDDIKKLCSMAPGISMAEVIQIYVACDKNVDQTAAIILG